MTSPSSPLAWKFAEIARFDRDGRYNDHFKAIFIKLRRYSATSIVEVALRRLSFPFPTLVEELKSFPWITLLLVKWALRDGNINIRVGRRISDQEFEHLLQLIWDLHDAGYGAKPISNVFLMMRGLIPAQLEFQRPATWGFLRWPALLARQPQGHRARRLFTEEFRLEPADFADLGLALYGAFLDKPLSIRGEWFSPLRGAYGPAIDRFLDSVSRDLLALRAELQSDQALKNRGRHELVEFPYLKRFPIVRMRGGELKSWHPTVFARGMEEIVHLRLGAHGANYSEQFSKLFEQYVVELLTEARCNIVTEARQWEVYGRASPAVEAILPFDGCTVFVEAKLGLFGEEVLHTDSEEAVHAKTKALREAARKAVKVINAMARTPEALIECPATSENFLVVVTNRELYIRGGEQLERLYPKGQYVLDTPEAEKFIPLSNIFYVAIDEFERLMGCVEADTIRLPDFLRQVSRSNGSPETAKQFLTDYLRDHVEKWPVPHLLRDARRSSEERLREALRSPTSKQ